jgi:hypothetical protein
LLLLLLLLLQLSRVERERQDIGRDSNSQLHQIRSAA